MTTTSQPMRTRPPAPGRSPAPGGAPPASRSPLTFGRPRRRRASRPAVALVATLALPVSVGVGLGAAVIHGYREHTRAASPPAATGLAATEATAPADEAAHAPTGRDIGTDGLTAPMVRAIARAREAARPDGITIDVVSGKRSTATQQRLFDQAIVKYGSAQAASRWVLPPDKSAHVTGEAVDIGPYAAAQWLEKNGVTFGLCRRYQNEYWHFELLAPAKAQACPTLEADASGG